MNKLLLLLAFLLILISGCSLNRPAIAILESSQLDNTSVFVNNIDDAGDFRLNIARGKYENITNNYKFCRGSVSTSEDIIWDGGNGYTFLTSAEILNISSSDVDDTFGGNGAWNIIIYGLDDDYNQIQEIVTLNGTNTVQTIQEFRRTYRSFVINSGNVEVINNPNEGTITIEGAATGTTQAIIQPNVGQTLMCIYTVPANHTIYITGFSASTGQGKQMVVGYKVRNCADDTICAFTTKFSIDLYQQYADGILTTPSAVPEKSDIVFTAYTDTGTNVLSASFGYILERTS